MADCSKILEYIKEHDRMCTKYIIRLGCVGCPFQELRYTNGCGCNIGDITQQHIDLVQKWSDEHPDIKPCPFCGKSDCVEFNWEESDDSYPQVQVICDATKGGCGSSSGFKDTEEEVLELWNKRVDVK